MFDIAADGKLTNKRNFGKYEGLNGAKESHADGIAVDAEGRVYVGIQPGVQVFSKDGKSLGLIPTSQRPQNLGVRRAEQADALHRDAFLSVLASDDCEGIYGAGEVDSDAAGRGGS